MACPWEACVSSCVRVCDMSFVSQCALTHMLLLGREHIGSNFRGAGLWGHAPMWLVVRASLLEAKPHSGVDFGGTTGVIASDLPRGRRPIANQGPDIGCTHVAVSDDHNASAIGHGTSAIARRRHGRSFKI